MLALVLPSQVLCVKKFVYMVDIRQAEMGTTISPPRKSPTEIKILNFVLLCCPFKACISSIDNKKINKIIESVCLQIYLGMVGHRFIVPTLCWNPSRYEIVGTLVVYTATDNVNELLLNYDLQSMTWCYKIAYCFTTIQLYAIALILTVTMLGGKTMQFVTVL